MNLLLGKIGAQEIPLVDGEEHVEPLRADRSKILVVVVKPIDKFLEAEEWLVNPEGTYWDTVTASGSSTSGGD